MAYPGTPAARLSESAGGTLPRSQRTRAGLHAETLEDLGETGKRASGGRDGGHGGSDGGRGGRGGREDSPLDLGGGEQGAGGRSGDWPLVRSRGR